MGICDSKDKKKTKRRLDTFEDIDAKDTLKPAEPPPSMDQKIRIDPTLNESRASTESSSKNTLRPVPKRENQLIRSHVIPSEKLSLIDQRDALTEAIRETNFFQSEVDDQVIDKLYSESTDGTFSTEALAKLLEQYVNICANFAKKEIQYQKEKLRKVRKEKNLDQKLTTFSPALDPAGPLVNRQDTGAMFGHGDKKGVSKEEAKEIFSREIAQMRNELAADLAAIEDTADTDEPELDTLNIGSDFIPTRDDSVIEMRKSLGDANLQRKCGETIVTCNSFISKLTKNPEAMLAGVPRTFRRRSFANFLPNFLESYAKELGVFELESMAATRSSDNWSEKVEPLQMGDLAISVFILSMTCLDVDLPWDPVEYKIGEEQTIQQVNEHLFKEHPGLEAYKEKFRTTLVQDGHVIDIAEWCSRTILREGDELTINF